MLTNFYSILINTAAPPTRRVDARDKYRKEQVNNINDLKTGVLDGSIPSAVADSGATSSVRTKRDRKRNVFVTTGHQADKAFRMPNCEVEEASDMDELSMMCAILKFADANYIAIFDKDEVNINDANKITIVVSRDAILQGWRYKQTNLWQVPLIKHIINNNTDTVLCERCPTEFLPVRPPPNEAIHQSELVRYYHAAAGFPTKLSWLKAIKNRQYASCPGLTWEAVNKHFSASEETLKGMDAKQGADYDRQKRNLKTTKTTKTTNQHTFLALLSSKRRQSYASTISMTKPSA